MAANILLVEDEPGIQELLKFNLAQAGPFGHRCR